MRKRILALLLCLAAAVPARAQEPAPTDWSQRTLQDVEAIDGAVRAVCCPRARRN